MRGIFDNDEPGIDEPEERPDEHEERRHDTEVTLSTAAQLGIVFCLLLLCALCFGAGYWVGHRGPKEAPTTAATQPAPPTAAPDQEPLQGSDTLPKPSADAQVPPSQPPADSNGTSPTPDSGTSPVPARAPDQAPAPSSPSKAATPPATKPAPPPVARPSAPAHPAAQPVRPAEPARVPEPQYRPTPAPPTYSPTPGQSAGQYMVQVAAVSHFEDANVLVDALRRRGYAATAQRMPDGLIHVRIGPFATHAEANRMSMRLLENGYNAMVQP